MRGELLSHWPPEPAVLNRWRELSVEADNVFLTPEWYAAWVESQDRETPAALLARDGDGEVAGVVPLVAARVGPVKLLRFPARRFGDWYGGACAEGAGEEAGATWAQTLRAHPQAWHGIALERIDGAAPWLAGLRAEVSRTGLVTAQRARRDVLPFIDLSDGGYDGWLATRTPKLRKRIGYERRRLERDHDVRFRRTTTAEELGADLDAFFALHDARWGDRGGSRAAPASARPFLRRFARSALERGWLRLWHLAIDGAPAAAWLGWRIGRRYCYALSGFDRALERLSVGSVIVARTIEDAAAEGAEIYDMMWGDEDYKRRLETGRREVRSALVVRRRSPAGAAVLAGARIFDRGLTLPPRLGEPLRAIYRKVSPR